MTVNDYVPLLEKICSRISGWTARHVSFAGRLQLIGSVIHSLTNFWISAFRLPKACIEEIDKLFAAFLWSGPDLNPRKAKVSWQDVCKPKEEGGLGLRSITEANKVSCLKMIWRILSAHSSLWVNWVRQYLIRKGSFCSVKEITSLGSWTWRKLLKYRELATSLCKVEVNNGRTTSFWFDHWMSLGRLIDITGNRGCIDLGIQLSSTVESVLLTHRRRNHRTEALNIIEDAIENQRQKGIAMENDVVLWKLKEGTFKCNFNSKETWKQTRTANPTMEWYKGIWFSYATPKYSFILWFAIQNRLSTGDITLSWNTGASVACSLCPDLLETRHHLFFACPYSAEVWKLLTFNLLTTQYTTHWDGIVALLIDETQDTLGLFLLRYVFQIAIYTIWRERNSRRHGEPHTVPSQLARFIDKNIRNRISSIREMGDTRYDKGMERWFATR